MYKEKGTFNDLVLKNYSKTEFESITFDSNDNYIRITNKNKINKLLSYLNEFKLVRYPQSVPVNNDDIYIITVRDKDTLGIFIENDGFLKIYTEINGKTNFIDYKIINNNLDRTLIKNILVND